MVIHITQEERPHDANRLHDYLIAAGIVPALVRSSKEWTEVTVGDGEEEKARAAIADYRDTPDKPRPTAEAVIAALALMNLDGVTTIEGIKAAIEPIRDAAAAVVSAESQSRER